MNINIFNANIAVGWLMFLGGSMMLNLAVGLLASGLLLLALTLWTARLSGLYQSNKAEAR